MSHKNSSSDCNRGSHCNRRLNSPLDWYSSDWIHWFPRGCYPLDEYPALAYHPPIGLVCRVHANRATIRHLSHCNLFWKARLQGDWACLIKRVYIVPLLLINLFPSIHLKYLHMLFNKNFHLLYSLLSDRSESKYWKIKITNEIMSDLGNLFFLASSKLRQILLLIKIFFFLSSFI